MSAADWLAGLSSGLAALGLALLLASGSASQFISVWLASAGPAVRALFEVAACVGSAAVTLQLANAEGPWDVARAAAKATAILGLLGVLVWPWTHPAPATLKQVSVHVVCAMVLVVATATGVVAKAVAVEALAVAVAAAVGTMAFSAILMRAAARITPIERLSRTFGALSMLTPQTIMVCRAEWVLVGGLLAMDIGLAIT